MTVAAAFITGPYWKEIMMPSHACAGDHSPQNTTTVLTLTKDQESALQQIEDAYAPGTSFVLTGYAGSGKTTLVEEFTKRSLEKKRTIVLTAPTHKAVAVLSRKIDQAGIKDVQCRTIHSLLSLKPKPYGDRLVFERDRRADPVLQQVVVIDECSMIDSALYRHIKRNLPMAFVLFVGDPAQLPPVGEVESHTFSIKGQAHLTTIVRQAVGNPILAAANIIRLSQGQEADWSWCSPAATESGAGVFLPGDAAHRWMQKAFTSEAFEADPDSFRYLAWTNRRVHVMNALIRRWRYGDDIPTPFMPGERAMFRAPIIVGDDIVFSTNEEAIVTAIERAVYVHEFPKTYSLSCWTAAMPSWKITLTKENGSVKTVHMTSDDREYNKIIDRVKDEAADDTLRWKHHHDFKDRIAVMQSIYALTVHSSQGSTFQTSFVDLSDIRRRERTNLLEMQQMMYVAATRSSDRLILVET